MVTLTMISVASPGEGRTKDTYESRLLNGTKTRSWSFVPTSRPNVPEQFRPLHQPPRLTRSRLVIEFQPSLRTSQRPKKVGTEYGLPMTEGLGGASKEVRTTCHPQICSPLTGSWCRRPLTVILVPAGLVAVYEDHYRQAGAVYAANRKKTQRLMLNVAARARNRGWRRRAGDWE